MPVRRLGIDVGTSVEVSAAWLVFPDLEVLPARQTYTRKSASIVLYQSASGFSAEILVDEAGSAERRHGDMCGCDPLRSGVPGNTPRFSPMRTVGSRLWGSKRTKSGRPSALMSSM